MPDHRWAFCRTCRRSRHEVGELSWTGQCGDCGELARRANYDAMMTKSGPYFEHWVRRSYMAARRQLLDSVQTET